MWTMDTLQAKGMQKSSQCKSQMKLIEINSQPLPGDIGHSVSLLQKQQKVNGCPDQRVRNTYDN